ncbi:hypothetical protein MML48_5g00018908 [Holotrichia oblita]|uniref:Uncharacterized protein n=1 Tax=Holotrichia oblita TaxID=644536 RepID=A0ACB9T5D1_HOLOL|nr:hypothetical protein MML48_5g00018908 [Holotrichia oblita]
MKGRLKKKIDLKKTGNKAIKLLEWEKKLLKAMEGDSNPTIGKIGGAIQMGIYEGSTQHTVSEASAMREETESVIKSSSVKTVESLLPTRKITATEKYETMETKGLTTKELQRLVLLEQYRTTRVQREYYEKKLERMKRKDSIANVVNEVDITYYNLSILTIYYINVSYCFVKREENLTQCAPKYVKHVTPPSTGIVTKESTRRNE